MEFAHPYAFLLLALLPLLRPGKPRHSLLFGSPTQISSLPPAARATLRTPLLTLLTIISALALIVALARPRMGSSFHETEVSGRDIILTLDLSGSMQAMDFFVEKERVNRLVALQSVVKKFIDERPGDRIGLVVFGQDAFTQTPLTLDHEVLKSFVDLLEIGLAGEDTAIGTALAIALKQVKDIASKSKVIVLVTDGKNNAGAITPREAARAASELGVKVHTIGIGGSGEAPFPVRNLFGGTSLSPRRVEYDERTLVEIAAMTGGQYFNAKDLSGLEDVYNEISKLEERVDKTHEYVHYEEQFFAFLLIGLVGVVLTAALRVTVFQVIPGD